MSINDQTPLVSLPRKRGRPPRETSGILEAAVKVFAREGYGAATIEMIATEASASTATLYKRFTNKHGLFVAVLKETTFRSLAMHLDNRLDSDHPFSPMLNRLEAHAKVSSDPQVRGVMRAWISEVRSSSELSELFAVNSGKELVTGLINQLKKLQDQDLLSFDREDPSQYIMAAQMMLGVVERFTLMRGLILGDGIASIFSSRGLAEKAVHAVVGIWGTPSGSALFAQFPKADLDYKAAS